MRQLKKGCLRAQSGFSLIEILISFVVLAVGLLGVASMQKKGVESNHSAYLRTQAVSLASDMANRVRANEEAHQAGNYNQPSATQTASCLSTGCTAGQLANHDFYEWSQLLQDVLPQGQGVICIDSTPNDGTGTAAAACDGLGSELAIKIWWDAMPRDGAVDQLYSVGVDI